MKNTGKEYENFVGDVQQILLNMDGYETIKVEQNKILYDRSGNPRQFDVYWEFKVGGHLYKNVIECKDYKSPISIEKIDAFTSKISDIPGLKGIFATKSSYQKGAKKKAEFNNISILTIRKPENNDWTLDDGTHLVREIIINSICHIPCRILEFTPKCSETPNDEIEFNALEDEIFIIDGNHRTSLYEIKNKLPRGLNKDIEEYITLDNGLIEIKGKTFKADGYFIKYRSFQNIANEFSINAMDYTKAYLEDHLNGSRKLIKNDGKTISLNSIENSTP